MFTALLLKVFPLYITMLIGYIAGKYLKADRNSISHILFYVMSPLVVLNGISTTELNIQVISLPILIWFIGSTISLIVYCGSALLYKDNTRNILAFSSGSTSMGYFGLPVAIALFDEKTIAIYIVCYVGMLLFENSIGFYIAANGIYTAKECLIKLAKIPSSYAMIAGLVMHCFDFSMPDFLFDFMTNIRSTFMILGTMLLGICVSNIKSFNIDWKLVFVTVITKYVFWPLVVLGLILLDKATLKLYSNNIYKALILLAVVPISGSGIIIANVLNYQPDRITIVLLISSIIGLFYVPLMISLLLY
ncbi:AEC family transporter [Candidatus Mesenet endosymbiont of Phosphuga atrata]|uniref:AEC family transporter n=1 Tax=Candidatus Mesenet endosymbiont of Phosphuga atrata TaxID=3066221 RepID=UPI0030D44BF3